MARQKTALVTGGAQRIGREIALHLHRRGFHILLHYRSSDDAAREVQASLNRERDGSCDLVQGSLDSDAEVAVLVEQVKSHCEALDLLVNNASGFEPTPIANCTPAQFDAMMASNLRGPYFLVQGVLPLLRSAGGNIVNIVDVHVDRPLRDFNVYGAAKAGLASLTRSLALELGPDIRVNGVAPGAILWPEDDVAYDEETRARTIAQTPLGRMGEPADIARTVAFLAEDAPYITGQIIAVDGGRGLG